MVQPVLSPCVGICTVNANGFCEGCFRTLGEIGSWLAFSPEQRAYLMETVLPQRENGS